MVKYVLHFENVQKCLEYKKLFILGHFLTLHSILREIKMFK